MLGLTQKVPLATGVPPHIDDIIVLKNLFDHCTQSDLKVDNYSKFLYESVFDVICQKVKAEGSINSIILLKVLNKLKEQLFFPDQYTWPERADTTSVQCPNFVYDQEQCSE